MFRPSRTRCTSVSWRRSRVGCRPRGGCARDGAAVDGRVTPVGGGGDQPLRPTPGTYMPWGERKIVYATVAVAGTPTGTLGHGKIPIFYRCVNIIPFRDIYRAALPFASCHRIGKIQSTIFFTCFSNTWSRITPLVVRSACGICQQVTNLLGTRGHRTRSRQ